MAKGLSKGLPKATSVAGSSAIAALGHRAQPDPQKTHETFFSVFHFFLFSSKAKKIVCSYKGRFLNVSMY